MKLFKTLLILILMLGTTGFAQEQLRSQLFSNVEELMNKARAQNGELFAPSNFSKAMKYYAEANDYYRRGKSLEDIRESIKNGEAYFTKVLDLCRLGEATFSSVTAARTDADSAGARKHATELWEKGEKYFQSAGEELESGSLTDAKEGGRRAEESYRTSELEAIKANYLSPARALLTKADEMDVKKNAQKTLQNAWRLARQVEGLLKNNRYDTDEARQLAQEAKIEAAHSIYLDRTIEQYKTGEKTFEDVLLMAEAEMKKVAVSLGVNVHFDNGLSGAVAEIQQAIKERDLKSSGDAEALRLANETVKQKNAEIENIKKQNDLMVQRLGTLSDAEKKLQDEGKELQRKLALKHEQEETVKSLLSLFNEQEANIVREGDNIIIRMYGLTFGVAKSSIESEFYPLLAKLQQAIRKFPGSRVTIEGHTDSQGSDDANQSLSEKRANAIAEYIMANMSVDPPINSNGYGESRPIASNDTPEGRTKNRRIDVVIVPQWK
ncbi:MAG: OmpA family protein [Ignavibacteriales bacterium]|nr:OmpA family protein [Ignavibacteriales bacterium]